MNTVTRRRFLLASGTAGLAAVTTRVSFEQLQAKAIAGTPLPVDRPILVVLTLYGGNDGLSAVIPYADPAYAKARPELAYTQGEVHVLGEGLGLNPAMTGMAQLWSRKQLAIVRGVGYPQPDHSHFRSMDIWQTASPSAPVNTGWIGRWLDATGDDPTRAVNIGAVLPPLAVGARGAAAALPLGRPTTLPADLGGAFTGLGKADAADTPFQALVAQSYCSERTVDATFGPIVHDPVDDDDGSAAAGTGGGQTGLAAQFDMVARCIKANVPTTVYTVSLGGFDTHANEKGTQQTQLGDSGRGVVGLPPADGRHPPREGRRGAGLLGVRPAGRRERIVRHRPRHGRAGVRRGVGREGRLLRRAAEPDRPGRRRPEVERRLPHRSTPSCWRRWCRPIRSGSWARPLRRWVFCPDVRSTSARRRPAIVRRKFGCRRAPAGAGCFHDCSDLGHVPPRHPARRRPRPARPGGHCTGRIHRCRHLDHRHRHLRLPALRRRRRGGGAGVDRGCRGRDRRADRLRPRQAGRCRGRRLRRVAGRPRADRHRRVGARPLPRHRGADRGHCRCAAADALEIRAARCRRPTAPPCGPVRPTSPTTPGPCRRTTSWWWSPRRWLLRIGSTSRRCGLRRPSGAPVTTTADPRPWARPASPGISRPATGRRSTRPWCASSPAPAPASWSRRWC